MDNNRDKFIMDKTEYYDSEERLGRSRKHRKVFETNLNVIDFEMHVLPNSFKVGGEQQMRKVYSHFLKKGYDYRGQ
jgi:hypothetical protein